MESDSDPKSEHKACPSKRRQQRQCIVEFLYMWNVQRDSIVEDLFTQYTEEKKSDTLPEVLEASFVIEAIKSIVNHIDFIDEKIIKFAQNWSFERIAKIDLAILRLAVYELCFCKKTPVAVVINEALELSKTYSSDDAKRFINGILDHIAKEDLQA